MRHKKLEGTFGLEKKETESMGLSFTINAQSILLEKLEWSGFE